MANYNQIQFYNSINPTSHKSPKVQPDYNTKNVTPYISIKYLLIYALKF